jgi:hypothetical protein
MWKAFMVVGAVVLCASPSLLKGDEITVKIKEDKPGLFARLRAARAERAKPVAVVVMPADPKTVAALAATATTGAPTAFGKATTTAPESGKPPLKVLIERK